MKKQLVLIHGGEAFGSDEEYLNFLKTTDLDFARYVTEKKTWKDKLRPELGGIFEIVFPQMPSKLNAKYFEWKIWFEKMIPHFREGIILAGHSLGGIFLVKYLSENVLPLAISALLLIATPYDDETQESLGDFKWANDLQKLEQQCPKIIVYHSVDDPAVPIQEMEKYKRLLPNAKYVVLDGFGHLNQEDFPELFSDLKELK